MNNFLQKIDKIIYNCYSKYYPLKVNTIILGRDEYQELLCHLSSFCFGQHDEILSDKMYYKGLEIRRCKRRRYIRVMHCKHPRRQTKKINLFRVQYQTIPQFAPFNLLRNTVI